MPIRGENVGTAYVKILADGTGLADSIRDELDDTDDVFDKKGKQDAESYDEAMRKQLKKDRPGTQKEVEERFRVNGNRIRQITDEMSTKYFKGIEDGIKRQNGESLGNRVVEQMRRGFVEGGGYKAWGEDMQGLFDRLPEYVRKANADILREEQSAAKDSERVLKERERAWDKMLSEASRMNTHFDEERRRALEAQTREEVRSLKEREAAIRLSARRQADYWSQTFSEAYRMNQQFDSSREQTLQREQRRIEVLAKARREADRENEDRLRNPAKYIERTATRMDLLNDKFDVFGTRTGALFGKGSRNDFLNFIGGSIEGVTKLAFMFPKAGIKATEMAAQFGEVFKATGSLSTAFRSLSGGGGGLASLAGGFGVIAVVLGVLAVVVPAVISAFVLLGGVITALAASISFALVGAVAVLAGAFLPVIAGVAALTAGILSMSDAQKEALKNRMAPLIDEFKELGRIASKGIFRDADKQAERLGKALKSADLERLTGRVSNAIRHISDGWVEAVDSPGFRRFVKEMGDSLPGQLEQLGSIAQHTIGGIGGLFIGMQPIVTRFLTWLDKITTKFSDWANSAEGQSQITSFFEKAGDSAASLGELIDNVGEAIGKLFKAGQGTGDTMIDQMAAKVQEFVDYLDTHPDALANFFRDAGKFGSTVGGVILSIVDAIGEIDTATSRSNATSFFSGLGKTIKVVGESFDVIEDAFTLMKGALETVTLPITMFMALFHDGIPGAIAVFLNATADVIDGLSLLGSALDLLPGVDGAGAKIDDLAAKMHTLADNMVGTKDEAANPINIVTNDTALDGTSTKVRNTKKDLEDLRLAIYGVADVPPVKPTVDLSSIKGGTEAGRNLQKGLQDLFAFPTIAPKVNDLALAASRLATLKAQAAFEEFAGVASKGTKIAIDAAAADVARNMVNDLRTSLGLIDKNILINITTRRKTIGDPGGNQTTHGATGGIMSDWGFDRVKKMAAGGFANFAQRYQIGESGREAIVPLDRPLGQVDPAVRMLSAFAQGKLGAFNGASNSKTIDASGWIIQSNSEDPRRVADEALNELSGAVF